MTTRRLPFIAGLAILAWAASVAAAPVDPSKETPSQRADRLFDESRQLLAAKRYAEACPKLAESQSLDPATGTLLALALCHEGQGLTASAYAELLRVSDAAAKEGRADRVKLAGDHLAKLATVLSRLVLTLPADVSATPGLAIECDGRAVPQAEWNQPTPLDPGEHVVAVSAPGRAPWRVTFVLPKRESKTLVVPRLDEVAHSKEEVASPEAPEESPAHGHTRRTAGFAAVGAGGVALAVGVGFGVGALVEQGDVNSACPGHKCAPGSPGIGESQTAQTYAWVSDVALGLGVVGLGVGAYLVLTAPKASKQGLRVVPLVGRDRAGVTLATEW
jgi:hypothetical protein